MRRDGAASIDLLRLVRFRGPRRKREHTHEQQERDCRSGRAIDCTHPRFIRVATGLPAMQSHQQEGREADVVQHAPESVWQPTLEPRTEQQRHKRIERYYTKIYRKGPVRLV